MSNAVKTSEGGVLERDKRLSESSLWKFQRQFFENKGVRAWSEHIVPTHVTSNAYIAEAYARIAMRFLQDCGSQPGDSPLALQSEEPVYIVELGAGSGYFAYLFVSKLLELQSNVSFAAPRVCYVATDFTRSNLDYWKQQPCFKPLIEYGLFDIARFDAENDEQIELELSGRVLDARSLANPLIVIANYLFDSIHHDVFRINQGQLEEGLTLLRATLPDSPDDVDAVDQTSVLDKVSVEFEYRPVEGAPYQEQIWSNILSDYADKLGNTSFTFPTGGLRCLSNFERLSAGRFLVISADKGYTKLQDLTDLDEPSLVRHGGCVSLMVNYHALGRYLEESQGGFMLASSDRNTTLEISLLCTASPQSVPETHTAFYEAIERFGPLDTYHLASAQLSEPTLDQVLTMLRLCRWDPFAFVGLAPALHQLVTNLSPTALRRTTQALHEVWKLYFPMNDGRDLPFDLGYLFYLMGKWGQSYFFYEHSVHFHGEHAVTFYNMGLCQYRLDQLHRALSLFEKSLAINGTYSPARNWKIRVETELAEGPELAQLEATNAAAAVETAEDSSDTRTDPSPAADEAPQSVHHQAKTL